MSAVLLACCALAPSSLAAEGPLHVPSPDWRDQVIYFLMIDRFDDGDPGNNDQGTGEYDPADSARYSGGDLQGVTRRLDYIRGLGATAVWTTPPVAHQWWNADVGYGGYHGYWGEDFTAVDPHFGTLEDYRALARALHGRGMYLVQDIVVNHTANFFVYRGGWDEADPARHFELIPDAHGRTAPTQPPFDRNDARDPEQRAEGIYHWTPDIDDYTDRRQELDFQLAGLDDLNTENPRVRHALRRSYGHWIREAGVDAFRVDTAFHVPEDFFDDFLHADDPAAPGVLRVAAETGRDGFHVFGEGFGVDAAFEDTQARRIERYQRDQAGRRRLPGMINFPLYGSLGEVFARGAPTAVLGHRIGGMVALHRDLHWMPSFIDNHDVDRFLAGADERALRQALLALMTLPGIPVIYAGTEQGFDQRRAAMFAGGYGSGGRDRFDAEAPLYRYLAGIAALRRAQPLFSRGTPAVLRDSGAGPGALVWRTEYEGEAALVAFNTADAEMLVDALETGAEPGTVLRGLYGIDGMPEELVAGANGRVTFVLPPRSGVVWHRTGERAPAPAQQGAPPALDPLPQSPLRGDIELTGGAGEQGALLLVVDGDLARAQRIDPDADGRWRARLRTDDMIDPQRRHRVVVQRIGDGTVSQARSFRVEREWTLLAETSDPAGDDHGPEGHYRYPAQGGWREHRQADIRGVRVLGSGGALRVELQMAAVTTQWDPPNGFDHVAFTLFVELPGQGGGARAMPLQNAELPGDMRWHRRLRAHGWSNALFAADGASSTHEGRPIAPAAGIEADARAGTVRFTLPAGALGHPASLSGARLYVNTWDYDGGYRGLASGERPGIFGGGDGGRDPLLMDDIEVIVLP